MFKKDHDGTLKLACKANKGMDDIMCQAAIKLEVDALNDLLAKEKKQEAEEGEHLAAGLAGGIPDASGQASEPVPHAVALAIQDLSEEVKSKLCKLSGEEDDMLSKYEDKAKTIVPGVHQAGSRPS